MRACAVLILASLLTSACQGERSFDERYDEARSGISKTAAEIDRDLAAKNPQPGAASQDDAERR